MQMKTINISVPKSMAEFIEHEIEQGEYASTSDFFRTLVRQYQTQTTDSWVDSLIRQRLATASPENLIAQSELEREFLGDRAKQGE